MKKKNKRFRLDNVEEKDSRLDVRITPSLREKLEKYCRDNKLKLTDAVTEALEKYLSTNQAK
jgi:hypothetical protein